MHFNKTSFMQPFNKQDYKYSNMESDLIEYTTSKSLAKNYNQNKNNPNQIEQSLSPFAVGLLFLW